MIPKRFKATIWRSDTPLDPVDTLDTPNPEGWTTDELAMALRRRYGPTVMADLDADGVTYRIVGSTCMRIREPE